MKAPQKSLKDWGDQNWRTKSGKPSSETGERYLPEKAIKSLTPAEYAATTKAKREGTAKGKQFVAQPKNVAKKTAKFRQCVITMYIAQFIVCMAQMCALLEQEPYIMHTDKGSCKLAASVQLKELVVLLKDKPVEAVAVVCIDRTNSIV